MFFFFLNLHCVLLIRIGNENILLICLPFVKTNSVTSTFLVKKGKVSSVLFHCLLVPKENAYEKQELANAIDRSETSSLVLSCRTPASQGRGTWLPAGRIQTDDSRLVAATKFQDPLWSQICDVKNILLSARLRVSGPMTKQVVAFWGSNIRNMVWLIWGSVLARPGKSFDAYFPFHRDGDFEVSYSSRFQYCPIGHESSRQEPSLKVLV